MDIVQILYVKRNSAEEYKYKLAWDDFVFFYAYAYVFIILYWCHKRVHI